MTFDPYAPPPVNQPPPPPGFEYPYGYPPPPKKGLSTVAILAIVASGFVVVAMLAGFAFYVFGGSITRTTFTESGVRGPNGLGSSFGIDVPPGWESEPVHREPPVRMRLTSPDANIEIRSIAAHERVPLDVALDYALVETGFSRLERADLTRSREVGGEPAILLQLTAPNSNRPDAWLVVFYGEGERWIVTYRGPDRGVVTEPFDLGFVLEGWSW